MFIETLEFTIPIDLCGLFSTLQKGPRSNLEFPASVNSYGTTQDACLQVAVRSNKLTFKVEGVSSDSSMISKSECKTLKLAVFDVDRSLIPQESENNTYETTPLSMSAPSKRSHDNSFSTPVPAKSSRTSYPESPQSRSPVRNIPHTQIKPRPPNHTQPKPQSDSVNVKQEPEDPDLIEIEPDPEPDDFVPKKETPYMQIDYSSNAPHTQTSQAALDRVSFPSSRSQSSSSSFHQNVPHVPDYSEAGPSHQGDQSGDDFLVFQEDNDYGDDNEADYSNDDYTVYNDVACEDGSTGIEGNTYGYGSAGIGGSTSAANISGPSLASPSRGKKSVYCTTCGKGFSSTSNCRRHFESVHQKMNYTCECGKVYTRSDSLREHIAIVHKDKTCYCSCGKMFVRQQDLCRHQTICSSWKNLQKDKADSSGNPS